MLKNTMIEKFKRKPKIPNIVYRSKRKKKIARLFLSQFQPIRFSFNHSKVAADTFRRVSQPARNNNLLGKFLFVVGHPELG